MSSHHSSQEDEPVIQLTHQLIQTAIEQSVSDIHIEPFKNDYRIRYRKDGLLRHVKTLTLSAGTRLVIRLKIMAELDISERRLPQDGRFQWNDIDVRANTCPTLFGEKIVLRLLYINKMDAHLADFVALGFTSSQKQILLGALSKPQGLILIAGPTGSGKTMTLYTMLQYLNSIEKNISTVEDPVEIQLEGINQINVHPKIGLHFSVLLRTLLRQDPDILMIGEIRDIETAKIAIQAAQTGHLVLSTVHAKNIPEAISRLQSLDVPRHDIASSLLLMITQRLIRKSHGDNYQGRTGIYEVFSVTPVVSHLIENNRFSQKNMGHRDHLSLQQAGIQKVLQGITTLNELKRVMG